MAVNHCPRIVAQALGIYTFIGLSIHSMKSKNHIHFQKWADPVSDEENDKLEQLIAQEKRAYAREAFQEFWDGATNEGIEADILAEIAVETALNELSHAQGRVKVSRLITQFKKMDELGLFPASKTMQ